MRSFRLKYVKYDMLKNRYCVLVYLVEKFATKCTTNEKKGRAKKIIRLQRRFFELLMKIGEKSHMLFGILFKDRKAQVLG